MYLSSLVALGALELWPAYTRGKVYGPCVTIRRSGAPRAFWFVVTISWFAVIGFPILMVIGGLKVAGRISH